MKRDAKRTTGTADGEAQVSSARQISGAADVGPAAHKKSEPDPEWLSMTTGDPALYLKDAE